MSNIISLLSLERLDFLGWLAPFLRDLNVALQGDHPTPHGPEFSRFIHDVEEQCFAVRLKSSSGDFQFSMLTHSHSIDEVRVVDNADWRRTLREIYHSGESLLSHTLLEGWVPWPAGCPINRGANSSSNLTMRRYPRSN
jgi:hypothetical protein